MWWGWIDIWYAHSLNHAFGLHCPERCAGTTVTVDDFTVSRWRRI